MATPINPGDVQDFDLPLNTDPDFTSVHVFSTADLTATFDGDTQGDTGGFIDFSGDSGTKTADGVTLYPIDSEFGFHVTDFLGAEDKEIDGLYTEGWIGDFTIAGEQAGVVISDAVTYTFKTPAVLGTWLTGLGSNTVKASTEHYSTMQHVLSDQRFPDDPDALYPLDNNLILLSQTEAYDGQFVADLLDGTATYEGAAVTVEDNNKDGVVDLKDLLNPNESTIDYDIAYSSDYSVTMKDDGKLLYRWGNAVKRPNDVRLEAELALPDEWNEAEPISGLKALYRITSAELAVHHTITNNPNDQLRPEDFENESAIGTLPTYEVIENYDGDAGRTVWASTDDYYAGDGTLYPAGTILRDSDLELANLDSIMTEIGSGSSDLELGFTNAWYTTMDREPFEPVLNADGTEYITGPRWRLQPDKYGQDLPSVVIPEDPSDPLPISNGEEKYEVGAETQTVINLLDWATPISPLDISAGWQNNAGNVSVNGLNMTENFDLAVYVKGDIKPATIYSAEVLIDHEEIELFADGAVITGTFQSDFLVGIGNNTFTGGAGEDLFVLSYGTSVSDVVTASVITDFEVGSDKIGLIGFDALSGFDVDLLADRELITQGVSGDDLTVSIDGELVATLLGVADDLDVGNSIDPGEGLDLLASFLITNPSPQTTVDDYVLVTGTPDSDRIVGTDANERFELLGGPIDVVSGLGGSDIFAFTDQIGTRDRLTILDYQAGEDQIDLNAAEIDSFSVGTYGLYLRIANDDGDTISVRNVFDFDDLAFTNDDTGTDLPVILGEAGVSDRLVGTDAAEILDGQGGEIDALTGAGGADIFVFTNTFGLDDTLKILDYEVGSDRIDLDGSQIASYSIGNYGAYIRIDNADKDVISVKDVFDFDDLLFVDDLSLA